MLSYINIAALALSLVQTTNFDQGSQPDGIVLSEPLRPSNGVLIRKGTCGTNQFSIIIRSGDSAQERLHSISVNGHEISKEAKQLILNELTPSTFIMDAYISECSRSSHDAVGRLKIIDKPWEGNEFQFLDFWISPDGVVSDVQLN